MALNFGELSAAAANDAAATNDNFGTVATQGPVAAVWPMLTQYNALINAIRTAATQAEKVAALTAWQNAKIKIIQYAGGSSRRRRQSKKRKNQRNHNNNQ